MMIEYNTVRDSGKREEWPTGSRRDTAEGDGRFDLLPAYPLFRLARHYENGAKKYGDRDWEKGRPLHRYIESALRHVFCFLDGQRDEDHLIAAVWNLFGYVWTEEMIRRGRLPETLDDIPQPGFSFDVAAFRAFMDQEAERGEE